ncbi:MAG: heme lyase CcmF/NrfE family subunit [Candidatus Mycalebacterium zealandia]|nr:MAG: heme lyase CcmF/NrfE family subunit [Candidatus Mycalebacterium zealandia]
MNLPELGSSAVIFCFLLSVYCAVCSFAGGALRARALVKSAENGVVAGFVLLCAAVALLLTELVSLNFELKYVAMNTSSDLPVIYRFTSLWAGQAGSLMLWCLVLGAYAAVFVLRSGAPEPLKTNVTGVISCVSAFFLFLIAFVENPFETLPFSPQEGRGLNPILQNPYMAIHPVALYIGYVGITVPYALGMGALLCGRMDDAWVNLSRKWTLFSWGALSLGLLLGARWAYLELGWGGYWAWDPVENAAFMPWLSGTAFLHSIMVQKRRNMFMKWNIWLLAITFFLSIFGTFITRSGLVSSVHSFAVSDIGPLFTAFLLFIIVFSSALFFLRRDGFERESGFDSALSRESAFVFNNVLFLAAAFVVFFGTVFPILSEAVTGDRILVGAPYFNRLNVPIGLLLITLMGIGPLLPWRKTPLRAFLRAFAVPLICTAATLAALLLYGMSEITALAAFSLCVFSAASAVRGIYKGAKTAGAVGGYIVHIGVALIVAGITASSVFATKSEALLAPGQSFSVGGYELKYNSINRGSTPAKKVVSTHIEVLKNGAPAGFLVAEKNLYLYEGNREINRETEVGLISTWKDDLYVVLVEAHADDSVLMVAVLNPMVSWIWAGGVVALFGAALSFLRARRGRA